MKLWTIREICELTGLSRWTVGRAMKGSQLESRKVGRSPRVRHEWLVKWLGFDPLEGSTAITIKKTIRRGDKETTTVTEIARAQG